MRLPAPLLALKARVSLRSVGLAALFLVVFLGAIRPLRTAVTLQGIYPVVQRLAWEPPDGMKRFELAHRPEKTYFELRPLVMEPGLKPYHTFRLEGGFMFLLAGMLMVALGGGGRAFAMLIGGQVVLAALSTVFLFLSLLASPVWLSGSYFIMRYLSPAICVMIAIGSVNRRF